MGSLQFLCLRIPSNGAKYWKVERSETDVTLISVDGNEGKGIIEREFSVDVDVWVCESLTLWNSWTSDLLLWCTDDIIVNY